MTHAATAAAAAVPTLTGAHVQLKKLSLAHEPNLRAACDDGELWKLWYAAVPRPGAVAERISGHLAAHEVGERAPFAVVEKRSGRAVGMTALLNIDPAHKRVEIGHTWIAQSVHVRGDQPGDEVPAAVPRLRGAGSSPRRMARARAQ